MDNQRPVLETTDPNHALAKGLFCKPTAKAVTKGIAYMAQRTNKSKRTLWVVCPHCAEPLDAEAAPRTKRISARKLLIQGILSALDAGPATPFEIEQRMGFRSSERTAGILRVLERKGEVKLLDQINGNKFIWARVVKNAAQEPRS